MLKENFLEVRDFMSLPVNDGMFLSQSILVICCSYDLQRTPNVGGSEHAPSPVRDTPLPNTLRTRLEEKERRSEMFRLCQDSGGSHWKILLSSLQQNVGPEVAPLTGTPGFFAFKAPRDGHTKDPNLGQGPNGHFPAPWAQYANPSTRK